ncbi:MAG TPA: histidine kinase [Cytophagales bacterium]|nr:histidine kinase [Cytophagales bacterium]HAP62913.1 histidine kinase [Cytophagales bacterium]
MFTNKEKRIQYLGFNDVWFSIFGIIFLSLSTVYIFNTPANLTMAETLISFVASLFFSTCDWVINRAILIRLRKTYPRLQDSTQRIALLFLGVLATVVAVDFLGVSLVMFFSDKVSYSFPERIRSLVVIIFLTAMVMAMYEAVYFFVRLKKSIREEEQAKQAIIQAQLDALQNQAQPHFFFNTLNTLRDIIDQSPKEEAMQFVDKLSDMYRFLLESGNTNLVPLKAELKFAKAYIHIQSERFGENLQLNWDILPSAMDHRIAPMSLQLLLENAIKHNVVSRAKPLAINITTQGGKLIVDNIIQRKSTQLPSTKLGLKNIEKRYGLITERPVEVVNDGHQFSVSLPLL